MKRISNCIAYCFLTVVVLCSQIACFEEQIILNNQDKKLIDSLYNAERRMRLVELDSLCELHFDGRVAAAVDSIMMKRLKEIRRLKGGGNESIISVEK